MIEFLLKIIANSFFLMIGLILLIFTIFLLGPFIPIIFLILIVT